MMDGLGPYQYLKEIEESLLPFFGTKEVENSIWNWISMISKPFPSNALSEDNFENTAEPGANKVHFSSQFHTTWEIYLDFIGTKKVECNSISHHLFSILHYSALQKAKSKQLKILE